MTRCLSMRLKLATAIAVGLGCFNIPERADALWWGTYGSWDSQQRKDAADAAMLAVVNRFNAYGDFNWGSDGWVDVYYNPGVPTAQANWGGAITFGNTWPGERVAMHELNHWLGSVYGHAMDGPRAIAILEQFDGVGARFGNDGTHFWPYGMNYDNEWSEVNAQRNVAIMYALRSDWGIGPFGNPTAWNATSVTLTGNDAAGESGFNFGNKWSDNTFAHSNADYSTGTFAMRTPQGYPSWKFAGKSLTVNSGGSLLYNGWGTTGVVTINNLILDGGTVKHDQFSQDHFQLAGHVELKSSSTFNAANGNITVNSTIGGTGSLTKTGGYTLTLTRSNFYTGITNINGGTLAINGQWALGGAVYGGLAFDGGKLQYVANLPGTNGGSDITQTSLGIVKPVTINAGGATVDTNGNNVTFANGIGNGGTGSFTKSGAGTLTLSGINSYSGATLVTGGKLLVAGRIGSANSDRVSVGHANGGNGTLELTSSASVSGYEVWFAEAQSPSNVATGSGLVPSGTSLNSTAWMVVGRSGNSSSAGALTVNGGTLNVKTGGTAGNLEIACYDAVSGTLTINSGAVNLLSNANLLLGSQNTSGSGTVNQSGGTVTFFSDAGSSSGGSGALTLGAASSSGTYTYHLSGGILTVPRINKTSSNNAAQGIFNFNGGTLRATQQNTAFMAGLTAANIQTGGAKIDSNGFDIAINQSLLGSTGDGGLTKNGAGTLTLKRANTFTGAVTINAGTLYADPGNAPNNRAFSFAREIVINSGATLRTSANGLFGWDGTQEKPITVQAGGTLTTNGGLLSDVGVGTVTLAGGTLASLAGGAGDWGSWRFDNASDKLLVTENSTASATNVKFGHANASIEVADAKSLNFTGTVTNALSGGISYLTKTGSGLLILAGANTHTGATRLVQGKTLVNGSLGMTAVSVETGASLGGTGSIAGSVNVKGILSPGASIESLSTGALTMTAGSTFVFEATDHSATGADLLVTTGPLSLTSVTLDLSSANLAAAHWQDGDKLTLISYLGLDLTEGFAGFVDNTGYLFGKNRWTIDYNDLAPGSNFSSEATGSRFVTLTNAVVPEPTSVGILSLAGIALASRRRKR